MCTIQFISTHWTKASRGGQAAIDRSAVPEALAVSATATHFSEHNRFQASTAKSPAIGDLLIDCEVIDEQLVVTYAGVQGVPVGQDDPPRTVFRLKPGEWGQLIAARRGLSGESEWCYGKHVANIYFGEEPPDDLFINLTPAHRYSDLRKMY